MTHQEWQIKFTELFSEIGDPWSLEIVSNPAPENGWLETRCKGMAKFECSTNICNNKWTSANGGAIFRYRRLSGLNNGKVELFLGGQKCKRCEDVFEDAKWDGVNIGGAIKKLLKKVREKCYGLEDGATSTAENHYIAANMTAPYQTHLCQACEQGVCQYNWQDNIESMTNQMENLDFEDYYDDDYDNYPSTDSSY